MPQTLSQFREKFRVDDLAVLTLRHWTWSLRPGHCTLGASVISLNRECQSFADLSSEEGAELATVSRAFETRVRARFGADKFNYLMLMMVDDQVHFHALPRYAAAATRFGQDWIDSGWPSLPTLGDGADLAQSPVLMEIRAALAGE